MRIETGHISASHLDDARGELRCHTDVEIAIIRRIADLPKEDNCHFARESFQNGAGYAYTHVDGMSAPNALIVDDSDVVSIHRHVVDTFFSLRPKNRYIDPNKLQTYRDALEVLVIQVLLGESTNCPDWIDVYELEAFLAFIEGYQLVAHSVTHNQH